MLSGMLRVGHWDHSPVMAAMRSVFSPRGYPQMGASARVQIPVVFYRSRSTDLKKSTLSMQNISDQVVTLLIQRRARILAAVLLITLISICFIRSITVNNDPVTALPKDLEEYIRYNTLQEQFPTPRSIIGLARFTREMPLREKVDSVSAWAGRFEEVEGIAGVLDLSKVRVPVMGGFLGLGSDYIVSRGRKQSDSRLRKRIRENREFAAAFVSNDESLVGMMMTLDESKNQVATVGKVVAVQKGINQNTDHHLHITGAPLYTYSIDQAMRKDFALLLPLCVVVVFGLLLWIFRRVSYVLMSLVITGIALLWTFGLMGLTGLEFSVVTAMVPVILFPIGVATAIHVFKTYARKSRQYPGAKAGAIRATFRELMKPIFLSAVTTFVGFASFSFSRSIWTRNFGIFSSIGVALALLLSIVLLPIFLSFCKQPSGPPEGSPIDSRPHEETGFWRRYRVFVIDTRQWLWLVGGVLVVGIIGYMLVVVDGNPISMFSPNSEIRRSDRLIEENLGGTRFMTIVIENTTKKIVDVEDWQQVAAIVKLAETDTLVGGSNSLLPLINKTSRILNDKEISSPALNIILGGKGLTGKSFGKSIGNWISEDRQRTKIVLICRNRSGTPYVELARTLKGKIESTFPGWKALVAGPPLLNDAMAHVLVGTQRSSLAIAFASVFLVLCLLFRSVKIGVFAVVPILFSTLLVYALMGLFGVAINAVTVIIVNTCIGIGIDYAIHYAAGYELSRARLGEVAPSLMEAAHIKGSVIMFNTLVVGVGFLVLAFSSFPPIRDFGVFVCISMLASATFALILLPALFSTFGKAKE